MLWRCRKSRRRPGHAQRSLDDLPGAAATRPGGGKQLISSNQATLESILNRFDDVVLAYACRRHVEKSAQGRSHLNPIPPGYLVLREPVPVKLQTFKAARLRPGNYDVDLRRHEIREAVQCEGGVMRDGGLRAGSKPSHDEVLEGRSWKPPEPIDAARGPQKVALSGVVAYEVAAEAQLARLRSSEVATLTFGEFVEALVVGLHVVCERLSLFQLSAHNYSPQG